MFRFTIRDVLWLTAMVAVIVTWQIQHANNTRRAKRQQIEWSIQKRELEGQVNAYKEQVVALSQQLKLLLPPDDPSKENDL